MFQFCSIIILLLSRSVYSFTNGTLLPSFLCGEPNDGYPKSLGGVLPFLKLGEVNTAYNQFPPGVGTIPIQINDGINNPNGNALASNAKQILGSFHNGQPATGYITATTNIITIVPTDFTDLNTGIVNQYFTITPNTVYNMSLVVNLPIFNNKDIALDGAFVYAIDTVSLNRVGSFFILDDKMSYWYACTLNNKFPITTGIVHNQLLSETPIYSNITWQSPAEIFGKIKFIGAGVSDYGYGPFSVEY